MKHQLDALKRIHTRTITETGKNHPYWQYCSWMIGFHDKPNPFAISIKLPLEDDFQKYPPIPA